jgi:hypothetical protein
VAVNDSASFSVTASVTSGTALSYQWQVSVDGGLNYSNLSSATSATLSLSGLTYQESGYKHRVVVSAAGAESVTSNAASLTVTPVISISSHPASQTTSSGAASFAVTASATSGATLSYQWQRSTNSGGSFSDLSVQTSSILSLSGLTTSSEGYQYRVVVSANGGATPVNSNAATLSVTPVVTIASQPENQTTTDGSASFSVSASATLGGTLSYQWQRSTDDGANFSDLSGETASTLSLSSLTLSSQGYRYRVVVSASGGATPVTSSAATLTVTPVISITSQPTNQTAITQNVSFSLSATVNQGATLSYQWQKQEGGVGAFSNLNNGPSVDGATAAQLTISGLARASDDGDVYRVIVRASGGASDVTSHSVTLSVPTTMLGSCGYILCGDAGNSCYENSPAQTVGRACLSDGTQIEYLENINGFKIWKDSASDKILKATGFWGSPSDWQKTLNRAGTGFTSTYFTSYSSLAGRTCPTHVFLNSTNMTAVHQCLYYDVGTELASLDMEPGELGEDYLGDWSDSRTGNGIEPSWYEGNIKVCADQGMRLPTLFETTADSPSDGLPSDAAPTFSGNSGVPVLDFYSWTATAVVDSTPDSYWLWSGPATDYGNNFYSNPSARCVLPAN